MNQPTDFGLMGCKLALPASARRNALLCALLMAACILAARPFADVPLGDDFSYIRTALDFARTGHLIYNGWATALIGWWAVWGAAFIKLFGFSFNVVRLSAVPVAMASVYLFHQVLVRFGLGARDAVLGCLTLGLSPLFFPMATSYLTDVPGVFVILLCLYMCQRAVVSRNTRTALLWLVFAGIVNVIGGTVRQTSWLGVLVMVPSTAWLRRRRRGMLLAGAATTVAGAAAVLACMRWAARQQFFQTEPLYPPLHLIHPLPVLGEYLKAFLCLLLLLIPITTASLGFVGRLKPAALLRVAVLLFAAPVFIAVHGGHGALQQWWAPWLIPCLQAQLVDISPTVYPALRLALTIVAPAIALIMAEEVFAGRGRQRAAPSAPPPAWRTAAWLAGPFALVNLGLLFQRAATTVIQDRYLLSVVPSAILLLILAYERWIAPTLPFVSVAALCLIALYTVAATHDTYAGARASHTATLELLAAGVPRPAIAEGFGPDLWEQLEATGYVNNPQMVGASTYYHPRVPWPYPDQCVFSGPPAYEPTIRPEYATSYSRAECSDPTRYAPVPYRSWLPPFHRAWYIQRMKLR